MAIQQIPSGDVFRSLTLFNGEGDTPFDDWYRRFEDLARASPVPLTPQLKVNSLIAHLDGNARDKISDLDDNQRNDIAEVTQALHDYYGGDLWRTVARQKLSNIHQGPCEGVRCFSERLRKLMRAAYSTYTTAQLEERARDDFIDRLKPAIKFHVASSVPQTFDEAVKKAQLFEHLLENASSVLSINPTAAAVWNQPTVNPNAYRSPHQPRIIQAERKCYRCRIRGHMARDCTAKISSHNDSHISYNFGPSRSPTFQNGRYQPHSPQNGPSCDDSRRRDHITRDSWSNMPPHHRASHPNEHYKSRNSGPYAVWDGTPDNEIEALRKNISDLHVSLNARIDDIVRRNYEFAAPVRHGIR